jgi:voltage-gated sodium channel
MMLLLVSSVYAIVATDLFKSHDDYFLDFGSSLFTLFQIATGDSWASNVARDLMRYQQDAGREAAATWVALIFVSYVLIVGVVLMNIVVAVGPRAAYSPASVEC